MASTSNSADIGIRVLLEDAASAGLGALGVNIGNVGRIAKTSGMLFGDLSTKLATLAVAAGLAASFMGFGGAIVYSVQQSMDLQDALTQIANAANLTTAQMQELQPLLLNLGANSIYSLQQLADGITVVGQYGFKTTQQIEDMAYAGRDLAEATGSDTVTAFKLLAVTMQAFNIPASQAQQTAELLFYSVEHGTPDMAALTTAMGDLGGASISLHLSLADIIPALDTITVGMGNASSAAAGLRYFLLNVSNSSSTTGKEMTALGISAFGTSGQFLGLKPVLQEVIDKVQGLSDATKGDILGKLFNIRSGTAIKQLISQIGEYEQGINNVSDKEKLHQQLMDAVARVMNNLSSIVKVITSNLQDFAALIGESLGPELQGFLSGVVVPLVTSLRSWASDPSNAKIVSNFLLIGAAISGVGLIIMGSVLSPIVAFMAIMAGVVVVVTAVAAGITWLQTNWQKITPVLNIVVEVLKGLGLVLLTVGAIIAGIGVAMLTQSFAALAGQVIVVGAAFIAQLIPQLISSAAGFIMMIPQIIATGVAFAANLIPQLIFGAAMFIALLPRIIATGVAFLVNLIPTILASAGAWLLSAAAMIIATAPYILIGALVAGMIVGLVVLLQHLGFLNVLLALGQQAWKAILPALEQAGAQIKGAFLQAIKQLQPVWQQVMQAFNQAKPILMALGMVLGVIIVTALGIVIGIIRAVINVIAVLLTTVIHVIAGIIQVFAGIVQFFMGFFKVIQGLFTGNWSEVLSGFKTMGQGLLNIVMGIWNAVSAVFVGAFKAIIGFVTGFIQGIIGFFTGLWDTLTRHSIIPDMLNDMLKFFIGIGPSILSGIGGWIGSMVKTFQGLPGQIMNALGDLSNLLVNAGKNLIQGFINGITGMISSVKNTVGNLLNNIRDMFPHSPAKEGPLTDAHLWMPNLIHMLSDTAIKAGPSLKSSMSQVAGGARAGLGSPTGAAGGAGGAGEVYNLQLDGKTVMSFFHNRMTSTLQANGVGRVLK